MDSNLVINDEYVQRIGRICKVRGTGIDKMFEKYINILNEIRSEAICAGEIAEALSEYIKWAIRLKGKIDAVSNEISTTCNTFIDSIDSADVFLFER